MDANIISKRSVDTYGVRNNKCPLAITFSESFLSPRFTSLIFPSRKKMYHFSKPKYNYHKISKDCPTAWTSILLVTSLFIDNSSPGGPGGEPPEFQQKALHLSQSSTEFIREASALRISTSSNDSMEIIDAEIELSKNDADLYETMFRGMKRNWDMAKLAGDEFKAE